MGTCAVDRQLVEMVLWAIGLGVPIAHIVAELIVILTHTPAPGSTWAKIYSVVELLAGQVGHAKETGLLPSSPGKYEKLLSQAEQQLAQIKKS